MKFIPADLDGAYMIELEPHRDERGSFARIWCRDEFIEHGLDPELSQCSISSNPHSNTLRGLHFQRAPYEETKLVRCIRGAIFDVIVDLRPGSPTRGSWTGMTLDSRDGRALYIPKGLAHGFQTLTNDTDVLYMISAPYVPEAAVGVRWDDPAFGIEWPEAAERIISERDLAWPEWV